MYQMEMVPLLPDMVFTSTSIERCFYAIGHHFLPHYRKGLLPEFYSTATLTLRGIQETTVGEWEVILINLYPTGLCFGLNFKNGR